MPGTRRRRTKPAPIERETRIYCRSGGFHSVPIAEYERVRDAWRRGEDDLELVRANGDRLTLSLEDVAAVGERTEGADGG